MSIVAIGFLIKNLLPEEKTAFCVTFKLIAKLIKFFRRKSFKFHNKGTRQELFFISFLFNSFNATCLFLYPLKTSESQRFSVFLESMERDQWQLMG